LGKAQHCEVMVGYAFLRPQILGLYVFALFGLGLRPRLTALLCNVGQSPTSPV